MNTFNKTLSRVTLVLGVKRMVKKASGHLNTLRIKELIISLIPLMSKQ